MAKCCSSRWMCFLVQFGGDAAQTCADHLDFPPFSQRLTLWGNNGFQFRLQDQLVGFIAPPMLVFFNQININQAADHHDHQDHHDHYHDDDDHHEAWSGMWGHLLASGSMEACDSQFSPGHFSSFQPQALIVLLPNLPQSILDGRRRKKLTLNWL